MFVSCSPPPPTTASEEPHSARTNHEAAPKCTTTTKYRPDVTWQRSPFVAGAHDSRRCRLESPHELCLHVLRALSDAETCKTSTRYRSMRMSDVICSRCDEQKAKQQRLFGRCYNCVGRCIFREVDFFQNCVIVEFDDKRQFGW